MTFVRIVLALATNLVLLPGVAQAQRIMNWEQA